MPASRALLQAIAVTAELTQTQLSPAAAAVMADDLARYPEPQVMGALTRCRRELKRGMSIADVLSRLDDGRPGPEQAWAMIPHDEAATVVWTDEMREAFGVAFPLLSAGDAIQARMAFLEQYRTLVQTARDAGKAVRWQPSLGHDPYGREVALREAVEKGRLGAEHVATLLPYRDDPPAQVAAVLDRKLKLISGGAT